MRPWKALTTSLPVAALLACGGGGGTQTAGIDAGGPPGRSAVVAKGTLTGFGSVIVNGVRYGTSSATFTIDGDPGVEADLAVGQVVTVEGSRDDNGTTGDAERVSFDDNVEGPVQSINLPGNSLVVLGQTVLVDGDTAFDDNIQPPSLQGISVGDIVEVSGFLRADGSISATRLEAKPPGGEFEVTGIVTDLNAGSATFRINDLVVDYSAAQLDDFAAGAPANGDLVETKGTTLGGSGELLANRVEFKGDDIPGAAGDDFELEGFITRFSGSDDFDVEGRPVTTNAQTTYEGGAVGDLGINVKLEVEGELDGNGVIVAARIEFKQSSNIRIEALVEDVQASQLTLLGIAVNVTDATRLEDKTDLDMNPLSLADINVGDFVAVRGFVAAGELTATRLERDDDRGTVALRAVVEAVSEPQFTLLGVTVRTGAGTRFEDIDDAPLTAGEFFDQALGRLVDVDGTLNGAVIQAEEVSLED